MQILTLDPFLKSVVDRFRTHHGCHTIILYGSRARGDANEASDYDIIGIRASGEMIRDTEIDSASHILDGFIYSDEHVLGKEREFLRIGDGRVLLENACFGNRLIEAVKDIYSKGPEPYPETEAKACRDWVKKMLIRARREDFEGNYRRHWLLFQLLEDYFNLRNQWYMGAKQALKELQSADPETFRLYTAAVKPGATLEEIEAVALRIIS